MSWQDCLGENRARKVVPDLERARSLVSMCEAKLRWLASQKINEETASPILANCFDALSELCDALLAMRGFKVSAASRDCVTCFISDSLHEAEIAEVFERYRKIRNRINYYGRKVSPDLASVGAKEITAAFSKLKSKYVKL